MSAGTGWVCRNGPTSGNIPVPVDAPGAQAQGGAFPGGPGGPMKKNILIPAVLALAPTAYAHDDHKLGTLQFPVSCNAEASRHFTTGMLLQYNYHWAPARKAFENAAAADAAGGIAHYGSALNLMDNIPAGAPSPKQLVDGRAALAKARSAGLPTP